MPEGALDHRMLSRMLLGAIRARGLTDQSAALEIGISPSTMSRFLSGSTDPGLSTYVAICRWLNVSLDTFITGKTIAIDGLGEF